MKYILLTLFACFIICDTQAQIPQGINYQGVVRAVDGTAIQDAALSITFDITDGQGNSDYSESHNTTTDANGIYSVVIGSGNVIDGDFTLIDWSDSKEMDISIDVDGDGTADIDFTSPLLQVPYALYARDVLNKDDADADPANEIQQLSITGNEVMLSSGGSIILPATEDADADPTNEIQQITITGNQITLSDGGTVTIPPVSDGDGDSTNEIQDISLNDHLLSITSGSTLDLSKYAVITGSDVADVPTDPVTGQFYYDEVCKSLYMYNEEGWAEIPLSSPITNIYDKDGDGVLNAEDNCVNTSNPDQEDLDGDGIGDTCDDDIDGDGFLNANDNCPTTPNADQEDTDNDGVGDLCETDIDGDGIPNAFDNCPLDFNSDQADLDADGMGNECDDDIDGDGLLNSQDNCPEEFNPSQEDTDADGFGDACDEVTSASCFDGLHPAYADFDPESYTIYIDDDEVVIETDGLPNHTSPYWSTTHPLYVAPTVTTTQQMAPGNIDNFNGSYTLRVPIEPQLASSSSATGLGAIGLAVSGSVIYNDQEGPNIPLDNAVGSLDYTAAHTGPQSYHYHLEPKAWSDDDDALIGIISDGFFLYGRKCASTGSYPGDLDASGGHMSTTQHCSEEHYHYHIENELYLGLYYILFPEDYQGTPNNIN